MKIHIEAAYQQSCVTNKLRLPQMPERSAGQYPCPKCTAQFESESKKETHVRQVHQMETQIKVGDGQSFKLLEIY